MSDLRALEKEKEELDEKLNLLCLHKYQHCFGHLPYAEQERINTQGHFMCAYSAILSARIQFAKEQSK